MCLCLFSCSVVAENDFLHTLLNKVTASRGDSGGQGTVPVPQHVTFMAAAYSQSGLACFPPLSAPWVRVKVIILMDDTRAPSRCFHITYCLASTSLPHVSQLIFDSARVWCRLPPRTVACAVISLRFYLPFLLLKAPGITQIWKGHRDALIWKEHLRPPDVCSWHYSLLISASSLFELPRPGTHIHAHTHSLWHTHHTLLFPSDVRLALKMWVCDIV